MDDAEGGFIRSVLLMCARIVTSSKFEKFHLRFIFCSQLISTCHVCSPQLARYTYNI